MAEEELVRQAEEPYRRLWEALRPRKPKPPKKKGS